MSSDSDDVPQQQNSNFKPTEVSSLFTGGLKEDKEEKKNKDEEMSNESEH